MAGARSRGAAVTDIGVVSTDMLYYYVARNDLEGGAIVTASHNPKQWNGVKMVRRGALALSGDEGIREIREWLTAGRYADAAPPTGPLDAAVVSDEYADHCLSFVDVSRIPRLKVVLDTANGMGAVGARAIFDRLPLETTRLYFELDGTFPNHPADPLLEENRRDLVARVLAEKADLGIAWDGDADRCFFVDDTGAYVPGDFVTAVLGEAFARREPGARIVYDVRASRAVADYVSAAGGVPLMNRVGHAFIKKRMRDEGAVVRRRGLGPLLLPRELVRRQRHDPGAADARAHRPRGEAAQPDPGSAARALPHLRRDQLESGRRRPRSRAGRGALHGRRASRGSTASRSTTTTGTSTCAGPTPSRCCGSTSRPRRLPRWSVAATRCCAAAAVAP